MLYRFPDSILHILIKVRGEQIKIKNNLVIDYFILLIGSTVYI